MPKLKCEKTVPVLSQSPTKSNKTRNMAAGVSTRDIRPGKYIPAAYITAFVLSDSFSSED